MRWKRKGEINKSEYMLKYSRAEKQGKHGVGFVIMEKLKENIMGFSAINERLAYLRIKAKSLNISILNVFICTNGNFGKRREGEIL